ncbi:hypothetical protein Fcan01_26456 [Folsomia candida]|uniref:Uncharacterized protein n=1 Tax=Folsomia candida TaxID=158441 RepID=A0A226D293_FOLCA|nr:hypothetical protein Fcan01_26456 [Folsomia candida]
MSLKFFPIGLILAFVPFITSIPLGYLSFQQIFSDCFSLFSYDGVNSTERFIQMHKENAHLIQSSDYTKQLDLEKRVQWFNDVKFAVGKKPVCFTQYRKLARTLLADQYLEDSVELFEIIPITYKFLVLIVSPEKFEPVRKHFAQKSVDFLVRLAKVILLRHEETRSSRLQKSELTLFCFYCAHQVVMETDMVQFLKKINLLEREFIYMFVHSVDLAEMIYPTTTGVIGSVVVLHTRKFLNQIANFKSPSGDLQTGYEFFSRVSNALDIFSFSQLLDYVMLENIVISANYTNLRDWESDQEKYFSRLYASPVTSFTIAKFGQMPYFGYEQPSTFVPVGFVEYKFLTCDVKRNRIGYFSYIDEWTWCFTLLTVLILVMFAVGTEFRQFGDILIELVTSLVEKPWDSDILSIPGFKRYFSIQALLILWCLFSTILSNGYKALLTTDVIRALNASSKHDEFLDLANFTVFSPIPESLYASYAMDSVISWGVETQFEQDILSSTVFYAVERYKLLVEHFATVDTEKEMVYLKPIAYPWPEHLVGNLTNGGNCTERAYVDTAQKIDETLEFVKRYVRLNDMDEQFLSNKKALETNMLGWMWNEVDPRVAAGLIERQGVILSSGIYNFWDKLYKRFRKERGFIFNESLIDKGVKVKGLGMKPNLGSCFVVCGILHGFAALIFMVEGTDAIVIGGKSVFKIILMGRKTEKFVQKIVKLRFAG